MIVLVLVVILADLSSAADDSRRTSGPINRWIELHAKIYKDSSDSTQINLAELNTIVEELVSIEQTEAYKLGLKPLIESGAFCINQYNQLVDKACKTDILSKRDSSITELLRQTLDHTSNDCTSGYLEQLNEIYDNFKDGPIALALQENRHLQYKNCWNRYMATFTSTYLLLGTRVREKLEKLVPNLYPCSNTSIINLSFNPSSAEYVKQSDQIVGNIVKYVKEKASQDEIGDEAELLRRYVQRPCGLLIESAMQVMSSILKLLRSINISGQSSDVEHLLILNTYILCYRIKSNGRLINSLFELESEHKTQSVMNTSMKVPSEAGESSSKKARVKQPELIVLNSLEEHDKCNILITEQPRDCLEQEDHSTPIESRGQSWAQKQDPWVMSVGRSVYKGRLTRYPATWSDGSVTLERRSYLCRCWPVEFDMMTRSLRAQRKARNLRGRKLKAERSKEATGQLVEPPIKRRRLIKTHSLSLGPKLEYPIELQADKETDENLAEPNIKQRDGSGLIDLNLSLTSESDTSESG